MYVPIIVVLMCNVIIVVMTRRASLRRVAYITNDESLAKRVRDQNQTTRILIILSVSFLFLHLTQLIARICQAFYPDQSKMLREDIRHYIKFNLLVALDYQITDFQNSINFILYCVFGRKMQRLLRHMFSCEKPEKKFVPTVRNSIFYCRLKQRETLCCVCLEM